MYRVQAGVFLNVKSSSVIRTKLISSVTHQYVHTLLGSELCSTVQMEWRSAVTIDTTLHVYCTGHPNIIISRDHGYVLIKQIGINFE